MAIFYLIASVSIVQILPEKAKAFTNIRFTWDDGTFYPDFAYGSQTPQTDGTWPELVSPGYGGSGYALKNNLPLQVSSTVKYETANNFNPNIGEISFKFKTIYDFQGDLVQNKFSWPEDVAYDSDSGYMYIADESNHRIIKTKFDGTGWQTLGTYGSRVHQFKRPSGIDYDPGSDFIYVSDWDNHRVVKTKIDGTGWQTMGIYDSVPGVGKLFKPTDVQYDAASEYLFILSSAHHRVIKTKFDLTGWTSWGSGATMSWPQGLYYDSASNYIYLSGSASHRIVKVKADWSDYALFGTGGSGVNQFYQPSGIYYDSATDFIYVADRDNERIVKTKIDGTGWTTFGTEGTGDNQFRMPKGLFFDVGTSNLYITDLLNNRIVKTQMGGTGWTTFGSGGDASGPFVFITNGMHGISQDPATDYIFTTDDKGRVIRTQIDGNGYQTLGMTDYTGQLEFGLGEQPMDVDYDSGTGYVFIADTDNFRIVRTKMDGSEWITYGVEGWPDPGEFGAPTGIVYDPTTEFIYVVDGTNDWIVKTKIDGTGWSTFGSSGCGVNQFNTPEEVDYDPASGFFYVADYYCNRIVKTKFDGTGWTTLGTWGTGVGQFKYPSGIEYDPVTDYIFVADWINNRVIKTKIDGTGWTQIGRPCYTGCLTGNAVGDLYSPKDVDYDPNTDYLYISDGWNQSIVKTKVDNVGWVRYNGTPIKKLFWSSGDTPVNLFADAREGRLIFNLSQTNLPTIKTSPLTLSQQTWHDVKIKFDNTTGEVKIWIDDVLKADETFTPWSDNSLMTNSWGDYFYIGSDPNDYNEAYSNLIDQFYITFAPFGQDFPQNGDNGSSNNLYPTSGQLPRGQLPPTGIPFYSYLFVLIPVLPVIAYLLLLKKRKKL